MEAIDAIQDFISGVSFEAFNTDMKLQAAVQFKLVVIGEAASKIPQHIRNNFPASSGKRLWVCVTLSPTVISA